MGRFIESFGRIVTEGILDHVFCPKMGYLLPMDWNHPFRANFAPMKRLRFPENLRVHSRWPLTPAYLPGTKGKANFFKTCINLAVWKSYQINGGISLSLLWKQGSRFSVPLARKISRFCQAISIGKPIAEIPPNPPLQRGQGGFLGNLFRRLNQSSFFK